MIKCKIYDGWESFEQDKEVFNDFMNSKLVSRDTVFGVNEFTHFILHVGDKYCFIIVFEEFLEEGTDFWIERLKEIRAYKKTKRFLKYLDELIADFIVSTYHYN